MAKRLNPYQRLANEFLEWAYKVTGPKRKSMWFYPLGRLNEGWKLYDLYERTAAAEQLGFDVILKADDKGLHVEYVEKRPEKPPYHLRWTHEK